MIIKKGMKLTENFSLQGFACKDGSKTPDEVIPNIKALGEQLQIVRDHIGIPIIINSGYRSKEYNKRIGGAKNSFHCRGMAADIRTDSHTPSQLKEIVETLIKEKKLRIMGIGLYKSFIHVDIRKTKTR